MMFIYLNRHIIYHKLHPQIRIKSVRRLIVSFIYCGYLAFIKCLIIVLAICIIIVIDGIFPLAICTSMKM